VGIGKWGGNSCRYIVKRVNLGGGFMRLVAVVILLLFLSSCTVLSHIQMECEGKCKLESDREVVIQ